MSFINSDKHLGRVLAYYFILIIFGFPICAVWSVSIGIDSIGSYIYRIISLVLIFYILFLGIYQKKIFILPRYIITLIVFCLLLYIRVIFDVIARGIPFFFQDDNFYILFFSSNTLLPVIIVSCLLKYFDYTTFAKLSYIAVLISSLQLLIYVLYTFGLSPEIFQTRIVVLRSNPESADNSYILNPITFALVGQQLSMVSITYLIFNKNNKIQKIQFLASFFIGFIVLLLGGSRGPILTTLLVFFILIFVKNYKSKNLLTFLKYIIGFIIIIFSLFLFIDNDTLENIEALRRIFNTVDTINNTDKEERVYEYAAAWNQFLENPIIGDQYVNNFDNYYAHNIFLELLMATGIIGTFLFLLFFVHYLKALLKVLYQEIPPSMLSIYILSISAFLLSMTSGSLYISLDFWLFILAVCGYDKVTFTSLKNH